MRILMISDFYHPFVGGVEQHVRSLSGSLSERGYEVAVVTLRHDGLPDFEMDQRVRVHRIQGTAQRMARLFSHPGRPWAPPVPDPELVRALARVVEREQPDIVHGHDWLARSFLPLKRRSRARLVMSLHYYTLSCAKKSLMHEGTPCSGPAMTKCLTCSQAHYGLAKGVPTFLGNLSMAAVERRTVDLFIAVSQATADGNGLDRQDDKCRIIPNFIPPKSAVSNLDVAPYISQLPDEPYLMFVGDLRRDKGLHVLLQAYTQLDAPPKLVLIGKVWDETPVEFPPNVVVLRDWPNQAVMEAWRRSLIAIVPSIWSEPFGIVVIEAMTAGRPVVASRIGGIPDIVVDGETGLLVRPDDPTALASALRHLLSDRDEIERMGRAGKERSLIFHADAVIPQIESVYHQLLAPGGHPASRPVNEADRLLMSNAASLTTKLGETEP